MTKPAPIEVRPAHVHDAMLLVEFNAAMARETEGRSLDLPTLERGVRALLDDPSRGRYFVAEVEDAVAGSLMTTYEWSDWRNGWFWWIQSVYVRPEFRRKGVYGALHRYVRQAALAAKDVRGLRIYVVHENTAARAAYRRLGMRESPYGMFEDEF